jgi:hypothetical protein
LDSLQLRFSASQYHVLRYLQQSVKFVHQKYLQHQLENHFPYLVFSDKLSLGDVIAAAGKYKSKFKASEMENDFQVDVEGISDEQILHSAVGGLRFL